MILKKLLIVWTVFIFQSCSLWTARTWKNEDIDKDVKEQIHQLNDKLIRGCVTNNPKLINEITSDVFKKSGEETVKFLGKVKAIFKTDSYRVLDEFYIKSTTAGKLITNFSGQGDREYILYSQGVNKETYVTLLLPDSLDNEILITGNYGKYGNNWKLDRLDVGAYNFLHKTPYDLYILAKDSYEKSYLMDAANYIFLSNSCIEPADGLLHYMKETQIKSFYEKVIKEMKEKYQFPLTLEKVESKPKIFNIFFEKRYNFYPVIQYLSMINLKDTIRLKIENESIKKEIGQIFYGLDRNKKRIYYQAYNELPDGNKIVDLYGFIDNRTN